VRGIHVVAPGRGGVTLARCSIYALGAYMTEHRPPLADTTRGARAWRVPDPKAPLPRAGCVHGASPASGGDELMPDPADGCRWVTEVDDRGEQRAPFAPP